MSMPDPDQLQTAIEWLQFFDGDPQQNAAVNSTWNWLRKKMHGRMEQMIADAKGVPVSAVRNDLKQWKKYCFSSKDDCREQWFERFVKKGAKK